MQAARLASFAQEGDGFERGGTTGAVVVLGGNNGVRDADHILRGEDVGLGIEPGIRADHPALIRGDPVFAVIDRLVHHAAIVDELFHVAGGRHPAQELDVLHRFIRPGVAGGRGNVAERAQMRAGRGLALHGHRKSGDRLEERVLVAAVLARPDRTAFVGHQRAHGAHRPDHRRKHARNHFLLGENHRGVSEPAGRVPGREHPVPGCDVMDRRPEIPHVPHADRTLRKDHRRDVAVHQRVIVQLLSADGLDAQQLGPLGGGAFKKLEHPVEVIPAAHRGRADKFPVVIRRHAEDGFQPAGLIVLAHPIEENPDDGKAPLGELGHRRERFKFDHDAMGFELHGPEQRAVDDLFVMFQNPRHRVRRDGHRGQREVEFRIDLAAADDHAGACGQRFRSGSEDEGCGVIDGERMVFHGSCAG